ncbi:SLC13 family permease [candidate division KSB1 bacterium]
MTKLLLVDDEDKFLKSLSNRLKMRGYHNITLNSGVDALKIVRNDPEIDVVVLDRKMPDMSGEQVLKEIKSYRPELQVIMLTGHGSTESAMEVGKLDAFNYIQKPCEFDRLISIIDAAREDKARVMARHEIPYVEKKSIITWLAGAHNSRPGFILLGIFLFALLLALPVPDTLLEILSEKKTGQIEDMNMGYADYANIQTGDTVADYYSAHYKMQKHVSTAEGSIETRSLNPQEVGFRAKVMLGVLIVAALFWATGAVPVGITALLVGVIMYFFSVLRPDDIAQAYAKDAVIFIFGVLAMAAAISKTGFDRRIGLLLLGPSMSISRHLFIFLPLLAMACSFLSEHALVAFLMPVMIIVYVTAVKSGSSKTGKKLAVMLVLSLCFAANSGGPGSPAAGGRNAVMLGILTDYGIAPTFGEWVKYGLPYVPVMALTIGLYFYLFFYRHIKNERLNISTIVKGASHKIGPMNRNEYITAAVLILLVTLWITASDTFGMGGPVILSIVLLNLFRVIRWRDISRIHWEVVALYASACAMGKGLAVTGAALYLAQSFVNVLPDFLKSGEGLAVAVSFFTGIATNFMSDGATVAAIGPITVPMATISGTHPWMIGFATAFASSFANMLIIGTPNNAIAFTMAKDPVTGEQLVTLNDFLKHGFVVLLLNFVVLWGWSFFVYWRWLGF